MVVSVGMAVVVAVVQFLYSSDSSGESGGRIEEGRSFLKVDISKNFYPIIHFDQTILPIQSVQTIGVSNHT